MKRLWFLVLAVLLPAASFACTTAVVGAGASATGRPMLWKQRDAPDPYNIIAHVTGGKFSYTGLFPTSDTLRTKCYAGINEAGFAIINNLSYNMRPDSLGFDTCAGRTMANALASCRSVEDFAGLLDSLPRPMNLSTNFGVADSKGGAAYFEVGDSTVVRYDVPSDGILFRTNYSLAGDPARGRGHERFKTMDYLTEPPGKFDAQFFLKAGRSFLKDGRDALASAPSAGLLEHDFIPRTTTVSSIVIECPSKEGEKGLLWCATGYTPCCYAIAAFEGEPLPDALGGPSNMLSRTLFDRVHEGENVKPVELRRIIKEVECFERREMRAAKRLMRRGLTHEAVLTYNAEADSRFKQFSDKVKK